MLVVATAVALVVAAAGRGDEGAARWAPGLAQVEQVTAQLLEPDVVVPRPASAAPSR